MRQRNTSGHVLTVMAWPTDADPDRRVRRVGPGEEIDSPELLGGFTPLDEPTTEADAGAQQDAAAEPAAKTKPTRKSSAAPAAEGSD